MANDKYNVVAITGEYEKGGETKKVYKTVGRIFESGGHFYLRMDSLVFGDDGQLKNFFSLYPPKEKESANTQQQSNNEADRDTPF